MWLRCPAVMSNFAVPEIFIWHCLQKHFIGPWVLLARGALLVMGKDIENDWVFIVFHLSSRPASRIFLWSQSSWRNHCSKPSMPKNVNGALCEICTYANRWSACSCVTGLPVSQRRQSIAISVIHSTSNVCFCPEAHDTCAVRSKYANHLAASNLRLLQLDWTVQEWLLLLLLRDTIKALHNVNVSAGTRILFSSRGWRIAVDVLIALDYLHKKGILHLHLNSHNVLLTEQGRARVG